MQDFIGGRLDFLLSDVASVLSQIRSGKARPLVISSKSPLFPDLPVWTVDGLPDVAFSIVAPAGTPSAIVEKMSRAVIKAMADPSIKDRLIAQGYVPVSDTPARFGEQLTRERAIWKSLIERNKLAVD